MVAGGMIGLIFAPPEAGLGAMWGPAAWAQSQLTPGVSALAAPPPDLRFGMRTMETPAAEPCFYPAMPGGMAFPLRRSDFARRI
jgi:hypothetical protein